MIVARPDLVPSPADTYGIAVGTQLLVPGKKDAPDITLVRRKRSPIR